MINLKNNEEAFKIVPIGIRYKCEVCSEGEMLYENNRDAITLEYPQLFNHKCNKCGMILRLPKIYPYIEWIPENEINERGGIDDYIRSTKISVDSES